MFISRKRSVRPKHLKWYPHVQSVFFVVVFIKILANKKIKKIWLIQEYAQLDKHILNYTHESYVLSVFFCCIFKILANNIKYFTLNPRICSVWPKCLKDSYECYVQSVFIFLYFSRSQKIIQNSLRLIQEYTQLDQHVWNNTYECYVQSVFFCGCIFQDLGK